MSFNSPAKEYSSRQIHVSVCPPRQIGMTFPSLAFLVQNPLNRNCFSLLCLSIFLKYTAQSALCRHQELMHAASLWCYRMEHVIPILWNVTRPLFKSEVSAYNVAYPKSRFFGILHFCWESTRKPTVCAKLLVCCMFFHHIAKLIWRVIQWRQNLRPSLPQLASRIVWTNS